MRRNYPFLILILLLILFGSPSVSNADEPAQSSIEKDFLTNIRQVTSGMVKAGEGYFSPDGTMIVYQVSNQTTLMS